MAKRAPQSDSQPRDHSSESDVHRWTFFTNHAHVLILLHQDPDRVLREIATDVGITERAVQRIVHDLEQEGFIEKERVGRRNRYRVIKGQHLRHPIEEHCQIDDLIGLIVQEGGRS